MNSKQIRVWKQERDDALRSMDPQRLIDLNNKYNLNAKLNDLEVAEIAMHKARTGWRALTMQERWISKAWLLERNYQPMDDGEVQPQLNS